MEASDYKKKRDFGLFLQITFSIITVGFLFSFYYFSFNRTVSIVTFSASIILVVLLVFRKNFSRKILYRFLCIYLSVGMLLFFYFYTHHYRISHIFILIIPITFSSLLSRKESLLYTSVFLILFIGLFLFSHLIKSPTEDMKIIVIDCMCLVSMYAIFTYVHLREELTYIIIYDQLKIQYDELVKAQLHIKQLEKVLPICSSCKKIKDASGNYIDSDEYIINNTDSDVTHGLCPDCIQKLYPEMAEDFLKQKKT